MALPTFNPPIAPSPGQAQEPRIQLRKAEFGDGYTQASPRGLNHIRQVVTLRWDGLTSDQMQELRTFFEGRAGYRVFLYQPHGFTEPLKWTCEEWNVQDGPPWRFTAQLVQTFTLET